MKSQTDVSSLRRGLGGPVNILQSITRASYRGALMLAAALATFTAVSAPALAREPGIASMIPPGLTLGLPIGASPPTGLYLLSRQSFEQADLVDGNGHFNGDRLSIEALSEQLIWVPGWELWGAHYKALISVPIVNADLNHVSVPVPGPLGKFNGFGISNPVIQPIDLSWSLGSGLFFDAALGVYLPISSYKSSAQVPIGGAFWTLEPNLGFSYLKDGWNASLHVVYDTSTENSATKYRSGDQFFINATLTKDFGGWNIGPVAYLANQVTADSNHGFSYGPFQPTFGQTKDFAVGGLVNKRFGAFDLTLFYTQDVAVQNTIKGGKLWFNVGYKFF